MIRKDCPEFVHSSRTKGSEQPFHDDVGCVNRDVLGIDWERHSLYTEATSELRFARD
jgi:hypothetical protein